MQKRYTTEKSVGGGQRCACSITRQHVVCAMYFCLPRPRLLKARYEKRRIGQGRDQFWRVRAANAPLTEEYRLTVRARLLANYSTSRIRDAIDALIHTKHVDTITRRGTAGCTDGNVELTFNIKRKVQAEKVSVESSQSVGDKVTEQEDLSVQVQHRRRRARRSPSKLFATAPTRYSITFASGASTDRRSHTSGGRCKIE